MACMGACDLCIYSAGVPDCDPQTLLRAANCNGDIFTLILLMLGLLYAMIMNVLSLVTSIEYFTSAGSLVFMITTIVLLSRNVYNICYKRPYGPRLVGTKRSTYKSTYSKSTTTLIETA